MFRVFGQAIRMFFSHILLFAAVILTVEVPVNFLGHYITAHVHGSERIYVLLATLLIVLALTMIPAGALVCLASELKRGRRPSYTQAMTVGLRNWGRLLAANALLLIFALAGLAAFVVPGVLFLVWYALIDPAVVLERARPTQALRRSKELTKGMRWPIFAIVVLWFALSAGSDLLAWWLSRAAEWFDRFWIKATLHSLAAPLYGVISVTLILFYLKAREREAAEAEPAELLAPPEEGAAQQTGIDNAAGPL